MEAACRVALTLSLSHASYQVLLDAGMSTAVEQWAKLMDGKGVALGSVSARIDSVSEAGGGSDAAGIENGRGGGAGSRAGAAFDKR
jgi:hypothetical protein